MKLLGVILGFAALGLTACAAPTAGVAPVPVPVPAAPAAPAIDSAPISVTRAVALFDNICGASLPDFTSAARRMAENGINQMTSDRIPTLFSQTEEVSFQLQLGPGPSRICSMVFGTTETAQAARAGFAVTGQFFDTPVGPGAVYRGTHAITLIGGTALQGTTTYLNLRLLSER